MSEIIDISVPIRDGMPVWPTDGPVELAAFKDLSAGGSSNVTRMHLGTHTGTHVDPPLHFIEGAASVDELPLETLIGDCLVVEDATVDVLDGAAVTRLLSPPSTHPRKTTGGLPDHPARVLFKTRSSRLWAEHDGFSADYVALDESGAEQVVASGVRLVGVDYLSVERMGGGGQVHRRLLESGVVVVEGLDLSRVEPGRYQLICLPLRIARGDGAPARAVLVRG